MHYHGLKQGNIHAVDKGNHIQWTVYTRLESLILMANFHMPDKGVQNSPLLEEQVDDCIPSILMVEEDKQGPVHPIRKQNFCC